MRKNKSRKRKENKVLSSVMVYLVLIMIVILASAVLQLFNVQATYNNYSNITESYVYTTESVKSLFSLSGLKYIFTNTVSNFANFTVLSNLIIILIGIGVMEYSGFLKTIVILLTKKAKKTTVTFWLIFFCMISSIMGDLPYIVMIPLSALIFKHAKRNPLLGMVASFAALTCGSAFSILLTSVDSSLLNVSMLNAGIIDASYNIGTFCFVLISTLIIIISSIFITRITEDYVAKKLPKYEFLETDINDELITKKQLKGLLFSGSVCFVYFLIVIYNIIPGLPFSGNLLDKSQTLYIDKLFSYESFFSNGFVFIITILFLLAGLFYGIGAKTITDNKKFSESLGHSLNGIGKVLVLIFMSSTFISIFKQTNIGPTIVVALTNLIGASNFGGFAVVILLFIASIIANIFVPNSLNKWMIMASSVVPKFMNCGLSPEFAQLVFRMGEAVSTGVTPLLAYFVIYLAYVEQYNNSEVKFTDLIKWQIPYAIFMFILCLIFITIFYLLNIPLGIGGFIAL